MVRVSEGVFAMPNGMIGLAATGTRVTLVAQSFARAMRVQKGRPERRVVYVKVSGGYGEDAIPYVGSGGSGIKILLERIIIGLDGHDGMTGQTGGILRLEWGE